MKSTIVAIGITIVMYSLALALLCMYRDIIDPVRSAVALIGVSIVIGVTIIISYIIID